LIAIDPLLESRHEACGIALNTPERTSRLASHCQFAPRLRERKNIASVTGKRFEVSARVVDKEWRGQHCALRSTLNVTARHAQHWPTPDERVAAERVGISP
jgi:hypothetical protein